MGLNLVNLDEVTRGYMAKELELDVSTEKLYLSPRLSSQGHLDYENLLKEAIKDYDDMWLAGKLRENGRINATEERRKPKGGTTTANVPVTAPDTLAEGEFNRFYARGLCLRAKAEGVNKVMVYRAKAAVNPRPESERMIGKIIDAEQLLGDLRSHIGVEPALGLPPGPNSGLSVRLP